MTVCVTPLRFEYWYYFLSFIGMSCNFNACEEEFLGKIQILLIKFFTDIKKLLFIYSA